MPREIIMPKVDMDMASGKVVQWHVAEGGRVEKGAPLFDIETDKAAMEVEAEADGIVHHRAPLDAEIAIGAPVAWLYADGEPVGDPPQRATEAPPEPGTATEPALATLVAPAMQQDVDTKTRATPRARNLARQHGLALEAISGTGPRGRVQGADILAQLETHAPAAVPAEPGHLSVTRQDGAGVPLVMIHGFAGDALSWAPLEAQLSKRARIRIDLPGHGKSPLRAVENFAALAKEIRAAVDALGLEQFDLVGHSLGGALALSLADIRPRKLRQLTLIAPAGLGPEINGASLAGICKATRPESLAPWLKTLVADEALITDAYVRLAMSPRTAELRAVQTAMADVLFPDGVQAFDLRAALDRLTVPARIIWGKRDEILPWKHALNAPGAVALHFFDKLGHIPHIEAPEHIGRLLEPF